MRRNWDTIREILVRLEELPNTESLLSLEDFPQERAYEISHHAELLLDAGLIEGKMHRYLNPGAADFMLQRLTWAGHEFLDAVRSDTVWNKTKKTFASKGLDMTFELAKSVATEITVGLVKGLAGA